MPALADIDVPVFDFTRSDLVGPGFHAALRELRDRGWLARGEPLGWFALDREAVAFFMRTPAATFPGRRMLELQGVDEGDLYERIKGNLLDRQGPDHRRLRRLVQPAFTVEAAQRHRPAMRRILAALLESASAEGRCDFVAAIARPYPALTIAELLGAPAEDAPRLHEWANLIQGQFDPSKVASMLDDLNGAARDSQEYVRALIERRRSEPGEDLISQLVALEQEGDRLSDEECVDIVSSVLVGAIDTTQSQLAHALRLFAEHPDQWRLLAEDPSLVPAAVEEVLRFEPVTPFTARIVLEDVEHRGVSFPEGTLVVACAWTANRDPGEVERPDEFDVLAPRERERPLTFGAGPHFCLGANLARAELQEALAFLAPRMRELELDGEPSWDTPFGVHALRGLPLRFSPR